MGVSDQPIQGRSPRALTTPTAIHQQPPLPLPGKLHKHPATKERKGSTPMAAQGRQASTSSAPTPPPQHITPAHPIEPKKGTGEQHRPKEQDVPTTAQTHTPPTQWPRPTTPAAAPTTGRRPGVGATPARGRRPRRQPRHGGRPRRRLPPPSPLTPAADSGGGGRRAHAGRGQCPVAAAARPLPPQPAAGCCRRAPRWLAQRPPPWRRSWSTGTFVPVEIRAQISRIWEEAGGWGSGWGRGMG